jgi:MYXO-CTERM domain-containing protein
MTVFTFSQSTASIPGLQVQASVEVNGTFANLPTISSSLPNPDFGNLISFSLSQNAFGNPSTFTLANFMSPGYGANDYFNWSISPGGIFFSGGIGDGDSFEITGLTSNLATIHLDSDNPYISSCFNSGTCYTTGTWIDPPAASVPEPTSLSLLLPLVMLLGLVSWRIRRRAVRSRLHSRPRAVDGLCPQALHG